MNFMFSINAFSAVFLVIGAIVTGEVVGFYEFAAKYPDVWWKIGTAAFVGSFGQIFIFMMISEFGPLPWLVDSSLTENALTSLFILAPL